MIKPAKHGRDHARGGEDPGPFGVPYVWLLTDVTVTAGVHSDDNVIVPHHPDYLTQAVGDGAFELTGDGGVWIPKEDGEGIFMADIYLSWSVGGWSSLNHYLVSYIPLIPFHGASPLAGMNAILGSALGPSTLEHNMSHNGAGMVNTTDRRKPELESRYSFVRGLADNAGFGDQEGWAWFPTIYVDTPGASVTGVMTSVLYWMNGSRRNYDL